MVSRIYYNILKIVETKRMSNRWRFFSSYKRITLFDQSPTPAPLHKCLKSNKRCIYTQYIHKSWEDTPPSESRERGKNLSETNLHVCMNINLQTRS